jgi:Nidogen-like
VASETDSVGNTGTATLDFTLATAPPTVTIDSINTATHTISGTVNPADVTVGTTVTVFDSVATNQPLTPYAASLLTAGHNLTNGLGGTAGFGTQSLAAGDDNSSAAIDITSVFGAAGVDFFGHNYTSLFINNNGNITFGSASSTYTPATINGGVGNPIIAPFWADVETLIAPGGSAAGADKVFYNLDSVNGVLTVTWDDVGYYNEHTDKLDAFQVQLISLGSGNFDIVFRYQSINWTTGDASGGTDGLGGDPARAGYSADNGNSADYFELPQSGNQAALLALPTTPGNTGIAGVDVFQVLNGVVTTQTVVGTATVQADGSWVANNVTLPSDNNTLTAENTDLAGNSGTSTPVTLNQTDPAGIAGSSINLGLTQASGESSEAITLTGSPANWTMVNATHNADGSWTALTSDFSTLAITPDINFVGSTVLHVTETWTNPDGSSGSTVVADNVEAFAPGSPIFAVAGDDHLTGTGSADLFVFAQPIGNDIIYNFNVTSDKIDLVGFDNITSFADIQNNIEDDGNGNAVIKIGASETITVEGVHAASITASDFAFNQEPTTVNPGTMQIGDGSHLPLSGTINNTGTIELSSTGDETNLQIIDHGITLEGAGQVVLSDSAGNTIVGTSPYVTLTNVDNTISGAGQIGAGTLTLVNEGTIDASGTNSLTIDTGANAVTNSGTLEASGAGGLIVQSNIVNDGFVWANGGSVTVEGNVTGSGTALISGSGSLEFAAASSANTAFAAGSTGTLVLDHSFDFSGVVSGMTASTHLDLLDFSFTKGTTINYIASANGSGGTLSVADGTHSANIALEGNFNPAGFQAGADHGTGTQISYHLLV